jgi:ribosomal protein L7/L12
VRLAVVRLRKSAADTTFDVVAADGVDPVRHASTLSRRADNRAYSIASLWTNFDHVRQLVASGNKMGVMKAYREATGVDLRTANQVIESLCGG